MGETVEKPAFVLDREGEDWLHLGPWPGYKRNILMVKINGHWDVLARGISDEDAKNLEAVFRFFLRKHEEAVALILNQKLTIEQLQAMTNGKETPKRTRRSKVAAGKAKAGKSRKRKAEKKDS